MSEFPNEYESLREYVERGIKASLQKIKNDFENSADPTFHLDYHNVLHTQGVLDRTTKILSILQKKIPGSISDHDIQVGRIAAAFHDVIQEWEPAISGESGTANYRKIRKRHVGRNEELSANQAAEFMTLANQQAGRQVFSQKDMEAQKEAILATVPYFDPKLNTVVQPNLTPQSSLIARSVALADLGFVGMCSAEEFLKGEDALFREDNLDIKEALDYFGDPPKILSEETKIFFRQRMLAWTNGRHAFANGRKILTLEAISFFPPQAQSDLNKLFYSFEEILIASQNASKIRNKMDFETLARDFGYFIK